MAGTHQWTEVRAERVEILRLLAELSPEEWLAPSLCQGWRVRDVVAHLLVDEPVRELGGARALIRLARWRFDVHVVNDWWVRRNADVPVDSLIERFERSLTPGATARLLGAPNQLRAAVIHHQDIRRPLGRQRHIPHDRLREVLQLVVTSGGGGANLGSRERAQGLRLHATDVDWAIGAGPEVTGPGESILMALAGRPVAATELAGEGREILLGRTSGPRAKAGDRP